MNVNLNFITPADLIKYDPSITEPQIKAVMAAIERYKNAEVPPITSIDVRTDLVPTNPLLVPALRQFLHNDGSGPLLFAYDKTIVDAVVEDLQRQLRVATMPTDTSTGITGTQSDLLVSLIQTYVEAKIANSFSGASEVEDQAQLQQEMQDASDELNAFLTRLRAPV